MKNPESHTPNPVRRGSKAKKASAASLGATILIVVGYLIASWLGIPLDGLTSSESNPQQSSSPRPVAVATDGEAVAEAPVAAKTASPGNEVQATTASPFRIENVTVLNLEGEVAFRGTVDLTATMRRIDAGTQLERFRNDGSTFQNRERLLPNKERGYYKEYVHQTPKLGGPGPQRVVTGQQGEAYYTFDHYKTFRKIR